MATSIKTAIVIFLVVFAASTAATLSWMLSHDPLSGHEAPIHVEKPREPQVMFSIVNPNATKPNLTNGSTD
jgi:flagellar basal body-associated protein FliL